MTGFIEGCHRQQTTMFPARLDDVIATGNPVRVIDAFVAALDLKSLGFVIKAEATGRPGYHPATMLRIYLCGYLNQIQSSRRLERECGRNVELMWLTGQLAPDFKTIADFRKDNGPTFRDVCRRFVVLSRNIHLLDDTTVAIDGSKFKAVNNREKNFTAERLRKRMQSIKEAVDLYLAELDRADRQVEVGGVPVPDKKSGHQGSHRRVQGEAPDVGRSGGEVGGVRREPDFTDRSRRARDDIAEP
jgi:transposase